MTETGVAEYCPECGGTVNLPAPYCSGGERAKPYRCCSCKSTNKGLASTNDSFDSLVEKIEKLQKWVDILLHLIPSGQQERSSSCPHVSPPPFAGSDLVAMDRALPTHVVDSLIAKAEPWIRGSYKHPLVLVAVCPYCGSVSVDTTDESKKIHEIKFNRFALCYDCEQMKTSAPSVFVWVTKILALSLSEAPPKTFAAPPPPPAPEPECVKRTIMVD